MYRTLRRSALGTVVLAGLVCAVSVASCSTVRGPSTGSEQPATASRSTLCFSRVGSSHHAWTDEGPFWEMVRLELATASGDGSMAGTSPTTGELGILLRPDPRSPLVGIEAGVACAAADGNRRACTLDCNAGVFEVAAQPGVAAIRLASGTGGLDLAACETVEPAFMRDRLATIAAGKVFTLYDCDR